MAESIIGLYETELVRNRGPWRGPDDLELATLEWVDWFNHRRLFHELGRIPPAEYEENYYKQEESDQTVETQTIEPGKTRWGSVRDLNASPTQPRFESSLRHRLNYTGLGVQ
jgi:putative transposase